MRKKENTTYHEIRLLLVKAQVHSDRTLTPPPIQTNTHAARHTRAQHLSGYQLSEVAPSITAVDLELFVLIRQRRNSK